MSNPVTTNFSVNQTLNSTLYPTRSQEQLGNSNTHEAKRMDDCPNLGFLCDAPSLLNRKHAGNQSCYREYENNLTSRFLACEFLF